MSINNDFNDFLDNSKTSPPKSLNANILNTIRSDMNPSHKIVFFKLLLVQAFIGIITLLFCPQFELSLTNNADSFHYFHRLFGENICMVICGFIFIGSGAIFAAYILKASEVLKIKQSKILYYFSISSIALAMFISLGAKVYFNLALYWFLGAFVGGIIALELNSLLRYKFRIA